jgi:rSAM/selenodomain-associated transferase 1
VKTAVAVMARAPSSPGKTRLAAHLSEERLASFRAALLANTLRAVSPLPHIYISFTPDNARAEIGSLAEGAISCIAQGSGDLGERMLRTVRYLLETHEFDAALLVGSDIPFLSADHLLEASATLDSSGGLVLGPADDGGYYLIGMTRPEPELFKGISWGDESVLTDTLRAAERIDIEARLVRSCYDVDTVDDLRRLRRDLADAPHGSHPELRRWFSENPATID